MNITLSTGIIKDKPLKNGKFFEPFYLTRALNNLDDSSRIIEWSKRSEVNDRPEGLELFDDHACAKIHNYHFDDNDELVFDIEVINEKPINDFINNPEDMSMGIRSISWFLDKTTEFKEGYDASYYMNFINKYGQIIVINNLGRFVIVYENE